MTNRGKRVPSERLRKSHGFPMASTTPRRESPRAAYDYGSAYQGNEPQQPEADGSKCRNLGNAAHDDAHHHTS